MGSSRGIIISFIAVTSVIQVMNCSDITNLVFGNIRDVMPLAFGDFNSDDLTDVFVLRNVKRTVEVFLAAEEEPLLRPSGLRCNFTHEVTSIVPGDFDGDAFMDILVTTSKNKRDACDTQVYIIWGGLDHVNCSDNSKPVLELCGQPLAIDYNQNMIIDLFGIDIDKKRSYWVFNSSRTAPEKILMPNPGKSVRHPHSHAYADLTGDYTADLLVTAEKHFELWKGLESSGFKFERDISRPDMYHVGQLALIDAELVGKIDLIVPVCSDYQCRQSAVMVHKNNKKKWLDLKVDFKDPDGVSWKFVVPEESEGKYYADAITLRSGDFNMDGYPDLLATLTPVDGRNSMKDFRVFLLENVPCEGSACSNFSRTFAVQWKLLGSISTEQGAVMGAFYDFYQDGVLDVIAVKENRTGVLTVNAFKNNLDYDANFLKVMVLTGLTNKNSPTVVGRLGRKKRTYGTNLPGPYISYRTTTQEGDPRHAASAQLPMSAHHTLGLPYNIFGLGRTPNFVDTLTVGLSNRSRDWTQIIPNSQMVVIPWPVSEPYRWRAQLFVTPSKLIVMSVLALAGVCLIIMAVVAVLWWRERREDRKERLQESHRFHFDAM